MGARGGKKSEHQHDLGRIMIPPLPILQVFYNVVDFFLIFFKGQFLSLSYCLKVE